MSEKLDEKVLLGLISMDTVLGVLSWITAVGGGLAVISALLLLAMTAYTGVLSASSGTATALIATVVGALVSGLKGGLLLWTYFQLQGFREAIRQIWRDRDEFFWEKSITEDRGLWVNAGIRGVVVAFLFLLCGGM